MADERAIVYFQGKRAGLLTRHDRGFEFLYERSYLAGPGARPISLSLPLREEPYEARELFPYFAGLLPEGWLLDLTSMTAKIDKQDQFHLLLHTARDPIGAVSVVPEDEPQ